MACRAVTQARRLADQRPDLCIVNLPVWAFPHFTMLAARELPGPLLLFSNLDPQYPGMVGMLDDHFLQLDVRQPLHQSRIDAFRQHDGLARMDA